MPTAPSSPPTDAAAATDAAPGNRPRARGGKAVHVAVDARMVRHSGIGTYLRELLPRVAAARPAWRFTLLGDPGALRDVAFPPGSDVRHAECRPPIYTVAEQFALPRATPRDADLLWCPHFVVPVAHRGPLVVTVHDVFHLAMPHHVGGVAARAYARGMFEVVRRRARRVLFDSAFSRDEFVRLVGAPRAAEVVHLGVGSEWHALAGGSRPAAGRPYLLYVGNVKPHKNVAALVRTFLRLRDALPHDLVLVGRLEGMRTADRTIARLVEGSDGRVRLAGEVDDGALRPLVAGASALALPSLYEGFGLPPLEAMAAGVPTLVSRAASLPEVCGDAAHYCDPHDEDDMTARLHELLTDESLRARLTARGRAHAARFTWERCAERTAAAIEETPAT